MNTHTHPHRVTPRHPDCPAAPPPRLRLKLTRSPDEGMEREEDGGERAVIDYHQNLCDTSSSITLLSPLQMALKSSQTL